MKKMKPAKILRWIAPCNIVALPGTTVRILTATVKTKRTSSVALKPRTMGKPKNIDITAITGMVSPMLAIAEPYAKFKLV